MIKYSILNLVCDNFKKGKKTECPILYVIQNKLSKTPKYFGKIIKKLEIEIPKDEEYFIVSCSSKTKSFLNIYHDKFISNKITDKPNVYILLLDGLSRVHFHRYMTETKNFLKKIKSEKKYNVFEFFKYHSVDYSSNSNQTPLVSGFLSF
jgi:hypothetical protein